jgi:NIPSNAP
LSLVAFPSREAAQKTWAEFHKDPAWRKVHGESHKNGALVKKVDSFFMEPTDYSEMK